MKLNQIVGLYLNRILNKIGYEVRGKIDQSLSRYVSDIREYTEIVSIVRKYTMVAPLGLASLYEQAIHCEKHKINGSFIECGVWKGGAIGLMALVNLRHSSTRRHIHLFDSFQEICEPDEGIDGERALREVKSMASYAGTKGRLIPLRGIYDHKGGPGTVKGNQDLLESKIGYDPNYLHYHIGWFQDTLPTIVDSIGEIALLRLDADWYASTKICLDYLFDKVVQGGFVIIDDYGAYEGCRKAVDEFLAMKEQPYFLNFVNNDIRYIVMS
jgi:O-methyltransferase